VWRSGGNQNPPGLAQDFVVRITDSDGDASPWIPVSFYAALPYPYVAEGFLSTNAPKSLMRSVRIPLAAFTVNSSQVNLNKLQTISFRFSRTAAGEVALDDIELVK
jgi:hypothetical protein